MEHHIIWIHIVFFSTWLGANMFCLAIFLPASRSLPPEVRWQARSRASRGLNTITAVSAPLVLISGFASFLLSELSSSLVLEWGNASIIGSKFILTAFMIVNHWRQAFRYSPATKNQQDERPQESDSQEVAWKAWIRLLTINVVLGFIVFFLGLSRG